MIPFISINLHALFVATITADIAYGLLELFAWLEERKRNN